MRYFHKAVASTPLYLPGGAHFPFETVPEPSGRPGHTDGIWKTDDAYLINEAEKAIRNGIGGVSEITAEQYEELAKKKLGGPSPKSLFSRPSLPAETVPLFTAPQQMLPPVGPPVVPVAAIEGKSTDGVKPIEVPKGTAFKKPKTAKLKAEA